MRLESYACGRTVYHWDQLAQDRVSVRWTADEVVLNVQCDLRYARWCSPRRTMAMQCVDDEGHTCAFRKRSARAFSTNYGLALTFERTGEACPTATPLACRVTSQGNEAFEFARDPSAEFEADGAMWSIVERRPESVTRARPGCTPVAAVPREPRPVIRAE